MSQGSLLSRMLGSRQPMSWLQPMIQTVVILRDKVSTPNQLLQLLLLHCLLLCVACGLGMAA